MPLICTTRVAALSAFALLMSVRPILAQTTTPAHALSTEQCQLVEAGLRIRHRQRLAASLRNASSDQRTIQLELAELVREGLTRLHHSFSTEERQAIAGLQQSIFNDPAVIRQIWIEHQQSGAEAVNRFTCDVFAEEPRRTPGRSRQTPCGNQPEIQLPGIEHTVLDTFRRVSLRLVELLTSAEAAEQRRYQAELSAFAPARVERSFREILDREIRLGRVAWTHPSELPWGDGVQIVRGRCPATNLSQRSQSIYYPMYCRFMQMLDAIRGVGTESGSAASEVDLILAELRTDAIPIREAFRATENLNIHGQSSHWLLWLRAARDAYVEFFFFVEDHANLLSANRLQSMRTNQNFVRLRNFIFANFVLDDGTEHLDHRNRDRYIRRQTALLRIQHEARLAELHAHQNVLDSTFEVCAHQYSAAHERSAVTVCGRLTPAAIVSGETATAQQILESVNGSTPEAQINQGLIAAGCPALPSTTVQGPPVDIARFHESPSHEPPR